MIDKGKFLHKNLTYKIIGAAMEVHSHLGPGYLEKVYENALAQELELRKIQCQQQVPLPVYYKNFEVGYYQPDILVGNKVVVELKAVSHTSKSDEAQLLNYLKTTGYSIGILINFGEKSLFHKRFAK